MTEEGSMTNTSEPPADAEADASPPPARRSPRPPSLLDAVLPIVVLIGLLALTIAFFGIDATNGPLQVALLLSAAFASLIAFKNGYSVAAIRDATVGGVTTAMSAIFILLAVGALIGTWNMAGTIPTVVDYGIRLVSPTWFYVTTAVICALVGMVTGSSWTTAGTLGVAFVGMAKVLGLPEPVAAGAVICGAYFGDKMTPLSETTILVPQLVGRGPAHRFAHPSPASQPWPPPTSAGTADSSSKATPPRPNRSPAGCHPWTQQPRPPGAGRAGKAPSMMSRSLGFQLVVSKAILAWDKIGWCLRPSRRSCRRSWSRRSSTVGPPGSSRPPTCSPGSSRSNSSWPAPRSGRSD
jgi:hypothetical protein